VPGNVPRRLVVATVAEFSVAKKETRDRIDLRIEPDLRDRLERQAERFSVAISAYIRTALVEKLERDEETDPDAGPD
jgi:predicted HicB family RNase H-like nuclease